MLLADDDLDLEDDDDLCANLDELEDGSSDNSDQLLDKSEIRLMKEKELQDNSEWKQLQK